MGAFSKLMAFTFATLLAESLSGIKNLVRKVKRLLIKVVPDSRLLGFLITLFLLKKESEQDETETQLLENLEKDLSKNELADIIDYLKILNKANFK
jgi:hypothetical protein